MDTIPVRVRRALEAAALTQKDLAERIEMTPDALSRALNGKRGFAAVELARISEVLGADLTELITGAPSPWAMAAASARHSFDTLTRQRTVPGIEEDRQVLEDIRLAYEQAGSAEPSHPRGDFHLPPEIPRADAIRGLARSISEYGVDVIRVEEISTDYSFRIAGRGVIVLRSTGNWFRQNWSLAHELGHLILDHESVMPGTPAQDAAEQAANSYAAELLLPGEALHGIDWAVTSPGEVAQRVWDWGVSTQALQNRLTSLGLVPSTGVAQLLRQSTQKVLRQHWPQRPGPQDPITERMQHAAQRLFPEWLTRRHVDLVAEGRVAPGTLAWMLGVPVEDVEAAPIHEPTDADLLALAEQLA